MTRKWFVAGSHEDFSDTHKPHCRLSATDLRNVQNNISYLQAAH